MTTDQEALKGTKNAFDDWRSVSTAIFMALVGYTVMVSVPVLSTALVDKVGFTEVEVGRIWGNDMLGLAVGAVIAALTVSRVNRRTLIMAGVILSIVANALCLYLVSYNEVMLLRMFAGIGAGIITGVAIATLGGTTRPVIAFNLELLGFAISTFLELRYLPQLTMNEIYIFFMILSLLCALLARYIPSRPSNAEELVQQEKGEDHFQDWRVPKYIAILCLVAVCFTYINIGGYYTYIELAATADGIADDWIGPVLAWSSIFAIVGCIVAYYATRFGLFKPLFVSLIGMAGVVIMLSTGITNTNIVISLFGFMTLWTFVDVYQAAMMGHMDRSGSLVALLPAVQGFGQFVGPNIAASVIGAGLGYGTMFVATGSMTLVAFVLYLGVMVVMQRRKTAAA